MVDRLRGCGTRIKDIPNRVNGLSTSDESRQAAKTSKSKRRIHVSALQNGLLDKSLTKTALLGQLSPVACVLSNLSVGNPWEHSRI